MPGKELARWTLTWFASALVFLALALALAVVFPLEGWAAGRALALVHLFALGWLGQAMLGALLQFVPVLAARPLARPGLALPVLLLAVTGTAGLATGFLALEGWGPGGALLIAAPLLLGLAFGLALVMLVPPLVAGRGWREAAGRSVLAALACLPLVWLSGGGMAADLAGLGPGFLPDGLPLHVLLAIGGWFGLASFGVGYRLFAMFLLAPELDSPLRRTTFALSLAALGLLLVAAVLVLAESPVGMTGAVLVPAGLAALCHMADLRSLWRSRRRAEVEPNMAMTRVAVGFLGLALLLAVPALFAGGAWAEAAVFAALAGWLSLLTLAQMVKIVSFLTWIQIFAPRIGRGRVPMVHDLTDPRAALRGLTLWAVGVAGGVLALLAGSPTAFRLAALVLLGAVLLLVRELRAIRRLSHLAAELRPAALPPLFLPPSDRSLRHAPFHDPIPRLDP